MDYYFKSKPLLTGLAVSGVIAAAAFNLFRRWVGGGVCYSKASLRGKMAIITGANTGIGLETAVDLAQRGARVILACRSEERGERAAVEVRKRSGSRSVLFLCLDLSSLESVRAFARKILEEEPRVDILINNAGICFTSYSKTSDGFEAHMGINHLGHFLLTNLLLPHMTSSTARVVVVSSSLYAKSSEFQFTEMNSSDPERFSPERPGLAYSQSKLASILFTRSLARRLEGRGITANVLSPGLVLSTELARDFLKNKSRLQKVSLCREF